MFKDNVEIKEFLSSKSVALIGVSCDSNSFSRKLMAAFINKGFTVFPVNPNLQEIDEKRIELPDSI